jgi:hypothetical protein
MSGEQPGDAYGLAKLGLTLMRPLVVKGQTIPISGFFAFFRFFLAPSSLGNVS